MGCDMHVVLEQKFPDTEWVGVWLSDNLPIEGGPKLAQRNYGFFALFGVRGTAESGVIFPRNLPRDVSRLAWLSYMQCPTDHHSASHCTIDEFCDAYLAANPSDKEVSRDRAVYDILGIWIYERDRDYRLVFWFDN